MHATVWKAKAGDQWESVGSEAATPAVAFQAVTLGESTSAQAHLAQAFVLSAQDGFPPAAPPNSSKPHATIPA